MYNYLKPNLISDKKPINNGTIKSLGLKSTKTKEQKLHINSCECKPQQQDFYQVMCQVRRKITTQKQLASMQNVSLQAWNKTTKLLSKMKRYLKKSHFINSWKITGDSFKIYQKALDVYQKQASQSKLSMINNLVHKKELLSSPVSPRYSQNLAFNQPKKAMTFSLATLRPKHRHKYLLIEFISMLPNCIKQMLLQLLSDAEKSLLSYYFKEIEHSYLPLSCF